jgi:hypothetical protein
MGGAFVTRNGRGFEPLDLPLHRSTNDVAFSPHDAGTAYLVQGQIGEVSRADPYSGIWRTQDTGRTWTQIYRMPQGTHACRGPWGKQVLVVDPHPERCEHLYFATIDDGLIRSLNGGRTWQGVAFQGLPVKTLAASRGPARRTVLYVIVGVKGRYGKRDNVLGGSFWRVDVEPAAPFQASTIHLSGADDFWDVEVATNDWSQGMVLRDSYEGGTAGARKLAAFKDGGQVLGKPRTAAEAGVKHFCDVHINPQDAAHVVVRSQGNLSTALQYSRDGGMTWNATHEVVDGYVPDLISYNPAHHNAPGGAMPDAIQQGQGAAVGFDSDDRRVVYWWTQNFDKTPLKSMDWGATWKPFAYGGPFKQAAPSSISTCPPESRAFLG